MEENNLKKIVEEKLGARVQEVFKPITEEVYYKSPSLTLDVSPLCIKKVRVNSYVSEYGGGKYSLRVYLATDGCEFALNGLRSCDSFDYFTSLDELSAYIDSDDFVEQVKNTPEWRYCTDEEYRSQVIREYTLERLTSFERELIEIIENVGSKEVMRILSPLNHIVAYGGDFEAVRNLVDRISDIMKENRTLKKEIKS